MARFIYQTEIALLADSIDKGVLRPGQRLLSVREFARERGIGVSTAARVYAELEADGVIVSRAKSGYFVAERAEFVAPNYGPSQLVPADLEAMPLDQAVQYSFNEASILPLSCTGPSTVLDNEALLNTLHRNALKRRPYRPSQDNREAGIDALREALARHFLAAGMTVPADDILITQGRCSALDIALAGLGLAGATLAVEAPCSFFFLANLQQRKQDYVAIPMQPDFTEELALLDKARREQGIKAYLFNPNFNDPTGRVLSAHDKRALLAWAEQHDIALIEFDRGELSFGDVRPPSCAALMQPGANCKLVSIGDFIDTVSFASSLGYAICRNCVDACLFSKSIICDPPDIATQYMYAELLASGRYRRLVRKLRRQMYWQYRQTLDILAATLDARVSFNPVNGGPCLWLALPEGLSSETLWQRLTSRQVSIAPGKLFMPIAEFERYFRITFALPWEPRMIQGLQDLAVEISCYINQNAG